MRTSVENVVVTQDGCRLWTAGTGQGEPLIMCHGGPGLWDMFGDLAAVLATRMRVIRWDQRGCGRSERRGPYTLARTVQDLDTVRRHFGWDRVAVLGHSWGATVALRYALDHPDQVSKLVYVSGTGLGWDWHEHYERNFAARLGSGQARLTELKESARTEAEDRELAILQWSADFADSGKAVGYAERMADPWFEVNYECNAAMSAEPRLDAEACRVLAVPTLIVDGAQDIRPRWAVDSLHRALPSVTRVVLRNAGHVPWLEAPDEFSSAVLRFL
ncbi:proline iminopeptidase [Kibdelosporangium banguiense]|uniref:Proline iminopeptidase n=1 Tax=Kibdelosporangium banguiense TaxID=1365924 RepID=A0ABS4TKS4_9PSEU|nr:alpha/beta hydrolase [Kibdelosporangium banguiense]MBP2325015.1 proline iminopeptidase [Kibdelosporangium banguiense]